MVSAEEARAFDRASSFQAHGLRGVDPLAGLVLEDESVEERLGGAALFAVELGEGLVSGQDLAQRLRILRLQGHLPNKKPGLFSCWLLPSNALSDACSCQPLRGCSRSAGIGVFHTERRSPHECLSNNIPRNLASARGGTNYDLSSKTGAAMERKGSGLLTSVSTTSAYRDSYPAG